MYSSRVIHQIRITVMLPDLMSSLHLSQTLNKCHFASGWLMFIKLYNICSNSIKVTTAETALITFFYVSSFMRTL